MTAKREDIDDSDVCFMYEVEGMTQQEIADYYGVSQMTVCYRLHPEKQEEHNKKWRLEHPEYKKEYYLDHSEELKEYTKQWRLEHPEYKKQWLLEHPEWMKTWRLEYPDKAQESDRKVNARRRNLGSIELNKSFPDSEGHHIDTVHIIHIPKELHRSIRHNVRTGENMEDINTIAFQYITEETFDKLIAGEI